MPDAPTTRESPPRGAGGSWERRFRWLLLGLLVFRVFYSAIFPLDLAPDESYYWDWGRRPDIGYYSKPPMIGWLMAFTGWVGNDSMFALKFAPAFLALAGVAFVFLLGRDLFGAKAGWWSALLLLATPGNMALGTFFTIDAPLFLAWSASLWLAWRWWSALERRGAWAMSLVLSLGLGYLSKQICLLFPLLLLVFAGVVARRDRWRKDLVQAMLITLGSLVFLLPPILWNWQHGWITIRHTTEELTHTPFQWGQSLKFLFEFIGGQAGLGGGLSWVLMMAALVASLRAWRGADSRVRFLALFSAPGLVCFTLLATHQRVEQNWPLVFYAAAAVLAGGAYAGSRWIRVAVGVGGSLGLALLAVPFVIPKTPLAGHKSDPTARIRGWRDLAAQVDQYRRAAPQQPAQTLVLAPDDRYVASALAYYLPDRPRVWCWEDPRRPASQYGIWGRPDDRGGWDAVAVVSNPESGRSRECASAFASWELLGEIRVSLGPGRDRDRRYQVFLGKTLGKVANRGRPRGGRLGARRYLSAWRPRKNKQTH